MAVLRFNGEDDDSPRLSSVMLLRDLQLNPLPRRRLPTRLLVEPLALRLVRLQEAPEEYGRRCFVSEFSPDPLAGSGCALRHVLSGYPVAFYLGVQLGTSGFCLALQTQSCNEFYVLSCFI